MKPASLVGQVLNGTYRLVRPIASGGAAEIYECEHLRQPGKRYAVKILYAAHNPVALQRFQREATITSELGHDNIVEVLDFAVAENERPYLVMELLEGEDLARRITRAAPMPLDEVVRLVQQIAQGLEAAHREGIVHRDLKPQNIFLCRRADGDDFVKLLDFGVSKVRDARHVITGDNMLTGTPSYMSPEQAEGHLDDVDQRTDIFALGAVVWEMLTGLRAFEAPTIAGTLYQVVLTEVELVHKLRPEIPSRVDVILRTAMSKHKRTRYSSAMLFAAQLADAAAAAAGDRPDAAKPEVASGVPDRIITGEDRPKRVLFVDDSPTMCSMVSTWLTRAGYEVAVANDGDEGAAKLLADPPDLVVADVNMPRRDGFALCRTIKDDAATRGIPLILFTRLNEATDIVNGLAAGADAFVIKGTGANDLLRQVEFLLPDAPDLLRRKTAALASLQDRLGPTVGRKAIFKRLFHALFREVPFDILALLVDGGGDGRIFLLGSHHTLSRPVADELTAKLVDGYAGLSGRPLSPADVDAQHIVIDETRMWGEAAVDLKRSVIVPILDGDEVIGCLGVFSFEDHPGLDANIRFFFDIGAAAAHALRAHASRPAP